MSKMSIVFILSIDKIEEETIVHKMRSRWNKSFGEFDWKDGKYYVAFYLKNDMEDFACLSNDMAYEGDGYNILHEIEIK